MRHADRHVIVRARRRRGVALLEVLVGLTLLATSGVTLLTLLVQSSGSVELHHRRDVETRAASAALDAIAIWPREQLDARVGRSQRGPWTVEITLLTPTLYRVTIEHPLTGQVVLRTILYRQADDHRR